MADNFEKAEPKKSKKERALRKVFELKDPKEEQDQPETPSEHTISQQKLSVMHPFFRDPFLLPKVSKHLRVASAHQRAHRGHRE
jgi:uncharacterized protein (DUF2225 family)